MNVLFGFMELSAALTPCGVGGIVSMIRDVHSVI